MELGAGVIAAGIANPGRAITPPLLSPPVEPIDRDDTTSTDSMAGRDRPKLVITLPEIDQQYPLPDPDTIATMQLMSGLPGGNT